MYKLIAIDLDGTLLDDEKKISREDLEMLNKVMNVGCEVVIATGRRYYSAKKFVRDLDKNLVILANNGNIVRKIDDDQVLIRKYLNPRDFYILVAEGKKRGLHPIVHVDNYSDGYDIIIEFDKDDEKYYGYMKNAQRFIRVNDLFSLESPKVLTVVYIEEKSVLEKFALDIKRLYPNKYSLSISENMRLDGALLEVMNPLGSKWHSLQEYGKWKKIMPQEIIAIGDDNNDVEMIEKAGLGIAMKNSVEQVKRVADIVTERTNNESGVACALENVLKL